ncbi:MAG: TIGR02206 family membrane protein [Actinomycetes bacterium]
MGTFFSSVPSGAPFRLFDRKHLAALAVTGVAVGGLIAAGRRLGPVGRRRTRTLVAALLVGQELSYHAWRIKAGTWHVGQMLPLHLCSVLVWGGAAQLVKPTRLGDDILWYWGVAGAPQALLTPDIDGWGFPHYRFFQSFVSHGLVLAVPLWTVFVEGRRPAPGAGPRAFATLLAHAAAVFLVNRRLGSNYLFLNRKPDSASLLDRLPAWPGYLPILVVLGAGVFALAWVPLRLTRPCGRGSGPLR